MAQGCQGGVEGVLMGVLRGVQRGGGSKGKMRILGILELIWGMAILETLMEPAAPESKQLA